MTKIKILNVSRKLSNLKTNVKVEFLASSFCLTDPSNAEPCTKEKSDLGNFFDAIRQHSLKNFQSDEGESVSFEFMWNRFSSKGSCMCDLMAPIVLLYPELITNQE